MSRSSSAVVSMILSSVELELVVDVLDEELDNAEELEVVEEVCCEDWLSTVSIFLSGCLKNKKVAPIMVRSRSVIEVIRIQSLLLCGRGQTTTWFWFW